MKSLIKIFSRLITVMVLLSSCQTQTEDPTPVVTNANAAIFSKYIAVGSSLASGYTNGGLYREGQLSSYPNLIALQAGIKFDQALFSIGQENGTGFLATSMSNNSAQFDKISEKTGIINTNPLILAKYSGSLNNYSIAGLRMSDMSKTGLGNAKMQGFNPYFERILEAGKEDIAYPDLIKESKPTFFTASLGEYDLLTYAMSGGKVALTETSVFAINCQKLLDALIANKAQGIITNVPNILDFPYFNYNTFEELAQKQGVSGIYITTSNGIIRLATANDKILMDAIPNIGKSNGMLKKGYTTAYPLSNEEVLDKDELGAIAYQWNDINGILKSEANKRNIQLFDLNNLYTQIKNKTFTSNSLKFDNSLMTGGFFSLDGINPTPRGSAVIANEIIKVINENYKNSINVAIPMLDVSKFEGLKIK